MDAREFLPIAERMSTSANEAERRTSIGRSYYGLFHVLLGALSDRGVIFRETPEVHRNLIAYLTKGRNKVAASVGAVLKDLRQERNRADYRLKEICNAKSSEFVYQKAMKALRQFESISESELVSLVKTIQALP
jgi:hypothetical protein